MLALAFCDRRVVAIQAKILTELHQEVGNDGLMGPVTTHALAILDRLMLNLLSGNEIGVAGEAERGHATSHSHAERVLMAGGAFPFDVGRMPEPWRGFFRLERFLTGGYNSYICLGQGGHPISFRTLRRDPIEEEAQPLALTG